MYKVLLALSLLLGGCTYNAQVSPSSSAAGEILPSRKIAYPTSYFVDTELASLNRDASEGYSCSAHKFPVSVGPAISSSIRSVNDSAFEQVAEGGTASQAGDGVERHLVFQLDSFEPRLRFEPGFFQGTAVANVELVLKVTVYDKTGNALVRTRITGSGYGEMDGGCGAGAEALGIAANQAVKRTMESYVDRVINAQQI
jgi:hypothetical protein